MFLTLLIEAALGGAAEALAGAGIEKAPHLAQRIQQAVDLVERQEPTAVEKAILMAVDQAREELLENYKEEFYAGKLDTTGADFIALLNHPLLPRR